MQEQTTSFNKLEEVKNLIFGQEIKDYNEQLRQLRENVAKNRSELLAKVEEVKSHLAMAVQNTEQNLLARIRAVQEATDRELQRQDKAHISRKAFSEFLAKLSEQLSRD
ncbi:MAG: hypothetical protein NZ551_03850 [Microscillaceae bacterium]|nr:hypothetical protein [Microscillaceae bacterium]MDW8460323.1 hypothetical protein [Cytophagales bacterium]